MSPNLAQCVVLLWIRLIQPIWFASDLLWYSVHITPPLYCMLWPPASVDLDRFLERTASGDWFRRDRSRAGGKRPAKSDLSESLAPNYLEWMNELKLREARFQFFFSRCQPPNFENVTLEACWREHFQGFLAIFLVAQLPPKEVF